MNRHTAPQTFATKREAEDWLATVRADVVRGTWRAPSLGAVTLADYAAEHLAMRVDLAPRTQQLYADVLAGWTARALDLPPAPGRTRGTLEDLGITTNKNVERAVERTTVATETVQAEVGRLALETAAAQRLAVWVGVGTAVLGALLGAFAGAFAARMVGS
ncbi:MULTISPECIES: hypothetical protein [unclassified Nocardioides]|uniref:hypothetical protein n=1 Tax=unclassified Nocardioides TaxID=2615069 RepID=UPI00361B54A0